MSTVSAQIVLRFAAAARQDGGPLLERLGLDTELEAEAALGRSVEAEAYYALLEHLGAGDPGLPLRYGASVCPEDFGAMGLALKTALRVREGLERIARYILVLSDTLEYGLRDRPGGASFRLLGRPADRLGARLANEGALAACIALLRQVASAPVDPIGVCFRHSAPDDASAHRDYFRCPVTFDAPEDALDFDDAGLATETRLGDEGLSAFLLARLEEARAERADRSLATQVRAAVTDSLCEGPPSRARIARQLGMSERTLHRRLADEGLSFRTVANRARRDVAEGLLALPEHSLAEVAFLTGFSDQSAFTRAFKRWSGRTPHAFREALSG